MVQTMMLLVVVAAVVVVRVVMFIEHLLQAALTEVLDMKCW